MNKIIYHDQDGMIPGKDGLTLNNLEITLNNLEKFLHIYQETCGRMFIVALVVWQNTKTTNWLSTVKWINTFSSVKCYLAMKMDELQLCSSI